MSTTDHLENDPIDEVSLDVRLDGERLEGELHRHDGTSAHFSGWVGLAAALEREREARRAGAPRAAPLES